MIVEDKLKTIEKAKEISSKFFKIINDEVKEFKCDDDPAEQMYLASHIAGIFLSQVCVAMDSYGKIYGIPNLNFSVVKEWINIIADENIKLNSKE